MNLGKLLKSAVKVVKDHPTEAAIVASVLLPRVAPKLAPKVAAAVAVVRAAK